MHFIRGCLTVRLAQATALKPREDRLAAPVEVNAPSPATSTISITSMRAGTRPAVIEGLLQRRAEAPDRASGYGGCGRAARTRAAPRNTDLPSSHDCLSTRAGVLAWTYVRPGGRCAPEAFSPLGGAVKPSLARRQ